MTTHERLQKILAADYRLAPNELTPAARLDDLGVDSLGVMELLFKIEDEFQIQMPPRQVSLSTLQDVVSYIDELVKAQRGSPESTSQAA